MSQPSDIYESPLLPLLEDSSDGIGAAAPRPWRLVYVNRVLAEWLGIPGGDRDGWDFDDVFQAGEPHKLRQLMDRVDDGSEPRACLEQELTPRGRPAMPVRIQLSRILVDGTPLVGIVVRRVQSASRNELAAFSGGRDPLTGLADRSVLLARMAAFLRGDRAADLRFAVLFIDLDNFKQVNDEHGHLIGDRVLVEVARRLAGCVRSGDLMVRYGGDEFVALVENVSGMSEIQPVIDRIHAVLARPITLDDGDVNLSVSVGMAEASTEHQTPEDLLRDADRAMYASKRAGI